MVQPHDIRRHGDGSIDFNFYRARAAALRAQAMRDAFRFEATWNFALTTVTTLITGAIIAASASAYWL